MISEQEWNSISEYVTRLVSNLSGRRQDYFIVSQVIDRDELNHLVWVKELGDIPIPLFAFEYEVRYIDETPKGTGWGWGDYIGDKKVAIGKVITPKIGEYVLIAREMGSSRMPRCLGALRSKNFATDEGETGSMYNAPAGAP